jgi:hypothetical protein
LLYSAPCSSVASGSLIDPQGTADLIRGFLFDGVDQVSNLLTRDKSACTLFSMDRKSYMSL